MLAKILVTIVKCETEYKLISIGFVSCLTFNRSGVQRMSPGLSTSGRLKVSYSPLVEMATLRSCCLQKTNAGSRKPSQGSTGNKLLNEFVFRMHVAGRDGIVPF